MRDERERDDRRGIRRGYRVLLLLGSLSVAIGVGLYTPGPQATILSRVILAVFTVSMLVAMATAVVLIPSPPDPRERARRLLWRARRDETESAEDDRGEEALTQRRRDAREIFTPILTSHPGLTRVGKPSRPRNESLPPSRGKVRMGVKTASPLTPSLFPLFSFLTSPLTPTPQP